MITKKHLDFLYDRKRKYQDKLITLSETKDFDTACSSDIHAEKIEQAQHSIDIVDTIIENYIRY